MWSSTMPSTGRAARAAAVTLAIAAGSGPSAPVAAVSSGATGPGTGPAVASVLCVTLMPAPPGRPTAERSGHPLVGGEREEVGVLVGQRHLGEQRPGVVPARRRGPGRRSVATGVGDRPHLLLDQALDELAGDRLAVGEPDAVVQPLPHLAPRDLGGGGVLHEVVDAHRAGAAQPGLQVLDADADVVPQPGLGHLARGRLHVEQLLGGDLDVFTLLVQLVGPIAEDGGERLPADLDHAGVRDPRAVEAVAGLPLLVRPDLGECLLVDLRVLGGDERGHAADRVGAALVAG